MWFKDYSEILERTIIVSTVWNTFSCLLLRFLMRRDGPAEFKVGQTMFLQLGVQLQGNKQRPKLVKRRVITRDVKR